MKATGCTVCQYVPRMRHYASNTAYKAVPDPDEVAYRRVTHHLASQLQHEIIAMSRSGNRQWIFSGRNFEEVQFVGRGSYGAVFEVVDENGEKWALKEIECHDDNEFSRAVREVETLTKLTHPYMLHHAESAVCEKDRKVAFITPFYENGSLQTKIHSNDRNAANPTTGEWLSKVQKWIMCLIDAVSYIHNRDPSVVHLDIKPDNILIGRNGEAILGDFGLAKVDTSSSIRLTVQCPFYRAPTAPPAPACVGIEEAKMSDWYQVGVVLLECITRTVPNVSGAIYEAENEFMIWKLQAKAICDIHKFQHLFHIMATLTESTNAISSDVISRQLCNGAIGRGVADEFLFYRHFQRELHEAAKKIQSSAVEIRQLKEQVEELKDQVAEREVQSSAVQTANEDTWELVEETGAATPHRCTHTGECALQSTVDDLEGKLRRLQWIVESSLKTPGKVDFVGMYDIFHGLHDSSEEVRERALSQLEDALEPNSEFPFESSELVEILLGIIGSENMEMVERALQLLSTVCNTPNGATAVSQHKDFQNILQRLKSNTPSVFEKACKIVSQIIRYPEPREKVVAKALEPISKALRNINLRHSAAHCLCRILCATKDLAQYGTLLTENMDAMFDMLRIKEQQESALELLLQIARRVQNSFLLEIDISRLLLPLEGADPNSDVARHILDVLHTFSQLDCTDAAANTKSAKIVSSVISLLRDDSPSLCSRGRLFASSILWNLRWSSDVSASNKCLTIMLDSALSAQTDANCFGLRRISRDITKLKLIGEFVRNHEEYKGRIVNLLRDGRHTLQPRNCNAVSILNWANVTIDRQLLKEMDVSGANLSMAIMSGCDLTSANLDDAILAGATLDSATLTDTSLNNVVLTQRRVLFGDSNPVESIAIWKKQLVAFGTSMGNIFIHNLGNGELVHTIHSTRANPIIQLEFSNDGSLLAALDNGISVWSVPEYRLVSSQRGTLNPITTHGRNNRPRDGDLALDVQCFAWLSNSTKMAIAAAGGVVYEWDATAREGEQYAYPVSPDAETVRLCAGPTFLLSQDDTNKIFLWSCDRRLIRSFQIDRNEIINSVFLSPDGRSIVVGTYGKVKLYSTTGKHVKNITVHKGHLVKHAQTTGNVLLEVATYPSNIINIWDVNASKLTGKLEVPHGNVSCLVSVDAQTSVSGSTDGTVRVWNLDALRYCRPIEAQSAKVTSMFFGTTDNMLLTSTNKATLEKWDIRKGVKTNVPLTIPNTSTLLGYSRKANKVAFVDFEDTSNFHVYDIGSPVEEVKTIEQQIGTISCATVSKDAPKLLACSQDGFILTWDLNTNTLVGRSRIRDCSNMEMIAVDAKGEVGAVAKENIVIATTSSGTFERKLDLSGFVVGISVSDEGRFVAATCRDCSTYVWSVPDGKLVISDRTPGAAQWSISFAPDERSMVSCGERGSYVLWELDTFTQLERSRVSRGSITHALYASNSNCIALASEDSTLRLVQPDEVRGKLLTVYSLGRRTLSCQDCNCEDIADGDLRSVFEDSCTQP